MPKKHTQWSCPVCDKIIHKRQVVKHCEGHVGNNEMAVETNEENPSRPYRVFRSAKGAAKNSNVDSLAFIQPMYRAGVSPF